MASGKRDAAEAALGPAGGRDVVNVWQLVATMNPPRGHFALRVRVACVYGPPPGKGFAV